MTYRLEMITELFAGVIKRKIDVETDEGAIWRANEVSDTVPCLICMDLYNEDGDLVKHWGK